jgi:hypothetical protein
LRLEVLQCRATAAKRGCGLGLRAMRGVECCEGFPLVSEEALCELDLRAGEGACGGGVCERGAEVFAPGVAWTGWTILEGRALLSVVPQRAQTSLVR